MIISRDNMNKIICVSLIIFIIVVTVSDFFIYSNWKTSNNHIDTSWWLLYANSSMATVISIVSILMLTSKIICCISLKAFLDCVMTMVCIGPMIKTLYYVSHVSHFTICEYLLRHVSGDREQLNQLKYDYAGLYYLHV